MRSPTSSSDLRFASLLVYSPRGVTEASRRSRQVTIALKQNDLVLTPRWGYVTMTRYFALRLAEELPGTTFPSWFTDATLVPIPRSSPQKTRTDLWPARELARAMVDAGIGREVAPLIERTRAVPKSAYCAPGERPSHDAHRGSFAVVGGPPLGVTRVVLVDDVVTRGATLLGAALRLRSDLPNVAIVGFAAVRTMSEGEIAAMLQPCDGGIRATSGRIVREP